MRAITIEDLNAAAHIGGAGSLVMRQELEPASGPDGVIAPAKYTMEKVATYIYGGLRASYGFLQRSAWYAGIDCDFRCCRFTGLCSNGNWPESSLRRGILGASGF